MKEGSIVKFDYDLWVHDDETDEYSLYETTEEQVAKDNDIHDEHSEYNPLTAIVGKGNMLQGLDESLKEAEVDVETEVEIPPEKGYGERRPDQVEFIKRSSVESEINAAAENDEDRSLFVGKHVHYKGRHGTVLMITGRKCRIDFNHPLAGRKLKYRYVVREEINAPEDIAKEIAKINYSMGDQFEFNFTEDELQVKLAEYCKFDPDWRMGKFQIISMLRNAFPDVNKIILMEEYPKPEPPAKGDEEGGEETGEEDEVGETGDGEIAREGEEGSGEESIEVAEEETSVAGNVDEENEKTTEEEETDEVVSEENVDEIVSEENADESLSEENADETA